MIPATQPPALPASGPVTPNDFPGWLPPMLVKELRQGLRTRGFVLALVIFQVVMVIAMLFATMPAGPTGRPVLDSTAVDTFFWVILGAQMLFFTPARALGGLQQEIDFRTLDLLMLTRLDAWRVVLGKWVSLLAQAALLVIAMLPYALVRYFTGSADLMADAERCALLYAGCAVLTAAGLWGSGLGKVLRAVMLIGGIVSLQGAVGSYFAMSRAVRSGGSIGTIDAAVGVQLAIDGVLLIAFLLMGAVRNIAPPAESYSYHNRLIGLLAVVPVPFAAALGQSRVAVSQLVISGIFLGIIFAMEFGTVRPVLARHWRSWSRRNEIWQLVGRCGLPGWQSALCFATFATVIWIICAATACTGPAAAALNAPSAADLAWLSLLLLSGLAFPAVLMAYIPKMGRQGPAVYFVLTAGLGVAVALSSAWAAANPNTVFVRDLVGILPFSSFWYDCFFRKDLSSVQFLVQGAVSFGTIGAGFLLARPYWKRIDEYGERDRRHAREHGVVLR